MLRARDGSPVPVSFTTSLLRNERRVVYGAIASFVDLTPLKRAEEHARQLDRLAALGRFTSSVAHEIRNPLTGIAAGVQYLSRSIGRRRRAGRAPELHPGRDQAARPHRAGPVRHHASAPAPAARRARSRTPVARALQMLQALIDRARRRRRARSRAARAGGAARSRPDRAGADQPGQERRRGLAARRRVRVRVSRGARPRCAARARSCRAPVCVHIQDQGAGIEPEHLRTHLRTLFHDQARRNRARSLYQPRHRQAPRRRVDGAQRAGPRHDVHRRAFRSNLQGGMS